MKVTGFRSYHLDLLLRIYPDDQRLQAMSGGIPETKGSFVYTVFDAGEIVAIMGVLTIWPGLGEVIFYKTPLYDGRIVPYTRVIFQLIDSIQTMGKFHRIQAAIPVTDHVAIRFIEVFKFKIESVLSKFGVDGEDYVRFVRFESCHS